MRKRYKNAEAGRSRQEPQRGRKAGRTWASRAASEACPVLCTRGAPPGWTALRSARVRGLLSAVFGHVLGAPQLCNPRKRTGLQKLGATPPTHSSLPRSLRAGIGIEAPGFPGPLPEREGRRKSSLCSQTGNSSVCGRKWDVQGPGNSEGLPASRCLRRGAPASLAGLPLLPLEHLLCGHREEPQAPSTKKSGARLGCGVSSGKVNSGHWGDPIATV